MTAAAIERLLYIMNTLRDPENGCPWDRKQTFDTIAPYTLEETYEVLDAIARQDFDDLRSRWAICCFRWCFTPRWRKSRGCLIFLRCATR